MSGARQSIREWLESSLVSVPGVVATYDSQVMPKSGMQLPALVIFVDSEEYPEDMRTKPADDRMRAPLHRELEVFVSVIAETWQEVEVALTEMEHRLQNDLSVLDDINLIRTEFDESADADGIYRQGRHQWRFRYSTWGIDPDTARRL